MKMNVARNMAVCVAAILLSAPLAGAQDLSKYRDFSLQSSLSEVSRQVNVKPSDATVLHQEPALIQDLTWWPVKSSEPAAPPEPVQNLQFSFYNGELYRMVVTYENSSTAGFTSEDMVKAVSTQYGTATVLVAEATSSTFVGYSSTGVAIAFWENPQCLLTLSRFPLSNTFQLVMLSKQLSGQADAAIAAAVKQERDDAPQKEIARVKKEAEDQETLRKANLQAFHP